MAPYRDCYREPEIGYLLCRVSYGYTVVAAHALYSPTSTLRRPKQIQFGRFVGFRGSLSSLQTNSETLFECLNKRQIPYVKQAVQLQQSPDPDEPLVPVSVARIPTNPTDQQFTIQWEIKGLTGPAIISDDELWSMRGGESPYFDVDDILHDLGLAETSGFKITMLPPVNIHRDSRIEDGQAVIEVLASGNLDKQKLGLGLIAYTPDDSPKRFKVDMRLVRWSDEPGVDGVQRGKVTVPFKGIDIARCFVSHNRICKHWYWISDDEKRRNNRRLVVETIDPELRKTRNLLQLTDQTKSAEGFESAIASVLWMLGFSPFQPSSQLTDAADIYAVSTGGEVLVVECTLGDMKSSRGSKIQNLLDRTRAMRSSLGRAGFASTSVFPVAVSGRNRIDLKDDTAVCQRDGIVLISRDEIQEILDLTYSASDTDKRVEELRARIQASGSHQQS